MARRGTPALSERRPTLAPNRNLSRAEDCSRAGPYLDDAVADSAAQTAAGAGLPRHRPEAIPGCRLAAGGLRVEAQRRRSLADQFDCTWQMIERDQYPTGRTIEKRVRDALELKP